MKILLVGGGSGGPVAPLLAVAAHIKLHHPMAEFLLVGTYGGPERSMAEQAGIPFVGIAGGKWRRYFSLSNIAVPFQVIKGFFQAFVILKNYGADCVFGAGSFVQVPMVWAAWLRRIPVVLHQQDVEAGLANRLCELAASAVTVTFEDSLTDFSSGFGLFYKKNRSKVTLAGNPFREELGAATPIQGRAKFNLKEDFPTLLVLGGGTGAAWINHFVKETLPELTRTVQIIHSTGPGKGSSVQQENYHAYEFIKDMGPAYAVADIVLARAGMSTITELSNLRKASIIIPMPDSHQELNAFVMYENRAAIVLDQDHVTPEALVTIVRRLLFEHELQEQLKKNIAGLIPRGATQKISDIIIKLAERHS